MKPTVALVALLALLALPAAALATFPYPTPADPDDYTSLRLSPSHPRPTDLDGKRVWMYASTPPPNSPLTLDRRELNGVRGAWVVDKDTGAPQAWHTTTGRPDVTIAVLDSGIQWNDFGKPMNNVRLHTRLSTGETPEPRADRDTSTDSLVPDCAPLRERGGRDLNRDGVFNILDYACDSRVDPTPPHGVGLPAVVGGKRVLDPQDVLIAFTDGDDDDQNGYADDIVGWDFVDDDNDPFDDVQYGHGSGEAQDSAGEADNGGDLGTCPNCMQIHMRVGTSFIADVNRFALATIYATDNGAEVVQEALGTLNKSRLGLDAVRYAYDHGTTVIASAADEAAQHHNWPSSYPYSIVVNSATHADEASGSSYLAFNGCTNFSSRITLAIPSVSCSSDATGRAAGMAGLVYSAALNAREQGKLEPHPRCRRPDGSACVITANEVRQVMASGTFGSTPAADDVDFAQDPVTGASTEPACGGLPIPGCTDPFAPIGASAPRLAVPANYPARKGHDQFYGYGRVNMHRAVTALQPASGAARVPPEVEVVSPEWFEMVDPASGSLAVSGEVWNRGQPFSCELYIAPGAYPKDTPAPDGDFVRFPSPVCDGSPRSDRIDGTIAQVSVADVRKLFPATAGDFRGPEGGTTGQTPNPGNNVGRPNDEPYSFVVKVVAKSADGLAASDRRQSYLHRDRDMLPGFPKQLTGDIEASPVLADVDGDNENELVVANSDGVVHAFERGGGEADGWPFRTDELPLHPGSRAFRSGAVEPAYGAVLATPAVGDLDRDGTLEVVVADLESKVYVIDGETGRLERKMRTRVEYSGKPLAPFQNVRGVDASGSYNTRLAHMHRTQLGFIASPVLADVDTDDGGRLEIVAAAMDRHVYVWNDDGSDVPGWPLVVADHAKLRQDRPFDPVTHMAFFADEWTRGHDQGAIIATPAVGDLDGDRRPEIVVGTNENYWQEDGEPLNAGGVNAAAYQALGAALNLANGRLYAIRPGGDPDEDPSSGTPPWLGGWPFRVGILQAGVLPLVGEGITGSPVIGNVPCQGGARARRVGVIPAAGVGYVVNADGQSCFGRDGSGKDIALNTEGGLATDQPVLAAFGHPAFAELAGGTAFLAPAAGLQRALDVVLPEYQGGQDYLVAWDLQLPQGTIKPGWPAKMNDLQFLTGPSIADLSPAPGEEVVAGSAHHDFQGFASSGTALPGWPKLSGDWAVANPAIGPFGDGETRVVVDGTRNGRLVAYDTGADPCGPASWPQFHHDPANSGDLNRDAVGPGAPTALAASADGELSFTSPGDDLVCGTPARYEVRTSDAPITPAGFDAARRVEAQGSPAAAGERVRLDLGEAELGRWVAVRAVDEQGNVGRPAVAATPGSPEAPPAERPPVDAPPADRPPVDAPPAERPPADAPRAGSAPAGERRASAKRRACLRRKRHEARARRRAGGRPVARTERGAGVKRACPKAKRVRARPAPR